MVSYRECDTIGSCVMCVSNKPPKRSVQALGRNHVENGGCLCVFWIIVREEEEFSKSSDGVQKVSRMVKQRKRYAVCGPSYMLSNCGSYCFKSNEKR